jgi:hypothetical protein
VPTPLCGAQEFPRDLPGQYLNKVDFFGGLVQARLLGNYVKQGRQRINLLFLWTEFSLGPFKFKKVKPLFLAPCIEICTQAKFFWV